MLAKPLGVPGAAIIQSTVNRIQHGQGEKAGRQFRDDLGGNDAPSDEARELVEVRQGGDQRMSGLLLTTSEGFTGLGKLLL